MLRCPRFGSEWPPKKKLLPPSRVFLQADTRQFPGMKQNDQRRVQIRRLAEWVVAVLAKLVGEMQKLPSIPSTGHWR